MEGFHTSSHFEKLASDMRKGAGPKGCHCDLTSVCLEVVDEFRNISGRDRGMNFQTSGERTRLPIIVISRLKS
jgi:hypothetical protein